MSEDEWRCRFAGKRKTNGNCEKSEADGFPAQGVGDWTPEKHDWLQRFIESTRAVRSSYVPVGPKKEGAAYIDLFAGPGRVRVENERAAHDGSPLIALAHHAAPFSHVVLCDLDDENVAALRARTAAHAARTTIVHGDCNERIDDIVARVPRYGLNLAFVDPFGPKALRWNTLAKLGAFDRMDLLVNFPTGFIKRNFHTLAFREHVTAILGDEQWRSEVTSASDVPKLIELLRARLALLGYRPDRSRSIPITNGSNVVMFYLVFFSKHALGEKIWKSLARTMPSGQKDLFDD